MTNLARTMNITGGQLDFTLPYETAGYIVAVVMPGLDEDEPSSMLPYGFFTGRTAQEDAQAFGERHIPPATAWTVVPVQSITMYERLDKLREMVTSESWALYGEELTPRMVAAFFDGNGTLPGRITLEEGELLLETLTDQGVMARLGRRKAWILNPDHKEN